MNDLEAFSGQIINDYTFKTILRRCITFIKLCQYQLRFIQSPYYATMGQNVNGQLLLKFIILYEVLVFSNPNMDGYVNKYNFFSFFNNISCGFCIILILRNSSF